MNNIIETISQFIQSLGFPIALCIAFFWKIDKQDQAHREERKELSQIIADNTKALIALQQTIEDTLR